MNYPSKRYTGPKPWMDKEWLYNEYVIKDRRTADIAEEYGCKQNTIQQWLCKHGIKKEIKTHHHEKKYQYEFYEYLYHNHIELHKSMAEIARENNVSSDTIRYHLIKNNIELWQSTNRSKYSEEEIDDMVKMYCEDNLSANIISKMFHTDHNTVIRQLRKRCVKTRGLVEAQYAFNGKKIPIDLLNYELLNQLHWNDKLSCKDLGEKYGVDPGTVRRQMNRIGVKTKTNAESKIGLMSGSKHPNWKGGITPLNLLLREYFQTNQAPAVLKRDNYTCQLCGTKTGQLHVHHIIPFSEIVSRICNDYPELTLDDIDDRYKLYNIIIQDEQFLDENNLITFCKNCHLYKIHNYNHKTISSQASLEEGSETIPNGSTL